MGKLICFNSEKQKKKQQLLFVWFSFKWEYCKDGQAGQGRELWM